MNLKIYFCGSIRAGREDIGLYAKIIDHLKKYGKVLTEHVGKPDVEKSDDGMNQDKFIHDRDVNWLKESDAGLVGASDLLIHDSSLSWLNEADVLVAEVTKPSLGVGYEIGRAVAMNKPCLFLFRPESDYCLSAMIAGAHDGKRFILKKYSEPEVFQIIDDYFKKY